MSDDSADRIRFLTVRIGDRVEAVEVGHVGGVVEAPATTPVANTTDAVAGVARLRGDVTVVLDGHAVCGVGGEWTEAPQAVVLERPGDGTPVALAVDSVEGMTDVHVSAVTATDDPPFVARVETDTERFRVFGVEGLADLVESAPLPGRAKD